HSASVRGKVLTVTLTNPSLQDAGGTRTSCDEADLSRDALTPDRNFCHIAISLLPWHRRRRRWLRCANQARTFWRVCARASATTRSVRDRTRSSRPCSAVATSSL